MSLQKLWLSRVAEMAGEYLNPETAGEPWAVAWSGGKDSTTVLKQVCQMLQMIPANRRLRNVHVVMSDTKMENPILESYMHEQVDLVDDWAYKNNMPLDVRIVSREDKRSFFVGIIGKGWTLPTNGDGRYCTHSLKIEPQTAAMKEINPCLKLIGTRSDESIRRSASIERWRETPESRFADSYEGGRVYMPIVDLTTEEVWQILLEPLPWGSSEPIRKLYKDATGECALINPAGVTDIPQACGARFGCWTCPPISKDKSTENMAMVYEWMKPLTAWRQLLKDVYNAKKYPELRSGYRRNGQPMGTGKGSLSIIGRKHLLRTLLETQEDVNKLRGMSENPLHRAPIQLISPEEIDLILGHWEDDGEKRPWLNDDSEHESGDWEKAEILIAARMEVRKAKKAAKEAEKVSLESEMVNEGQVELDL